LTHCPEADDDNDTKSRSSHAKSVKKLKKEVKSMSKSMKKAFAQLKEAKGDSDLSDSDKSEGESHFQFHDGGFQFTQVESEFKPQIAELFKQRDTAPNSSSTSGRSYFWIASPLWICSATRLL
jgi:hypothetical protein